MKYRNKNLKRDEKDTLRAIKKYVKITAYRRIVAAYKDKRMREESICIPYRVKRRDDKNKQFIRSVAKLGRLLYLGSGNDTQTVINIMDMAFKRKDYILIGPLAELLDPDEDDIEAIRLKNRLLYSRSNLTEFNVPAGKKQKERKEC